MEGERSRAWWGFFSLYPPNIWSYTVDMDRQFLSLLVLIVAVCGRRELDAFFFLYFFDITLYLCLCFQSGVLGLMLIKASPSVLCSSDISSLMKFTCPPPPPPFRLPPPSPPSSPPPAAIPHSSSPSSCEDIHHFTLIFTPYFFFIHPPFIFFSLLLSATFLLSHDLPFPMPSISCPVVVFNLLNHMWKTRQVCRVAG